VQGESDANDANGRRRSVALFDPVAGMRAMADIQAEGLRAASELLERILKTENDGPSASSPDHDGRPGRSPAALPEGDYAALVDAWAQLLQRVAGGLARPVESGAVTIPVDSSAGGPPVRLVLARSEHVERAVAEVWLHNGTATPVGPLALGCGALAAPDGEALDVAVSFDPAEVPLLEPRSSRGVVVSVEAGATHRSGIYRGVIQADGAPKLWLPLEVTVEPC